MKATKYEVRLIGLFNQFTLLRKRKTLKHSTTQQNGTDSFTVFCRNLEWQVYHRNFRIPDP